MSRHHRRSAPQGESRSQRDRDRDYESPTSLGLGDSYYMEPDQASKAMRRKWDFVQSSDKSDEIDRDDQRRNRRISSSAHSERPRSRSRQYQEEDSEDERDYAPNSEYAYYSDEDGGRNVEQWSRSVAMEEFRSNYGSGTLGSTYEEFERSDSARGRYPKSPGTDGTSYAGSTKSYGTSVGYASDSEWEGARRRRGGSTPSRSHDSRQTSQTSRSDRYEDRPSSRHYRSRSAAASERDSSPDRFKSSRNSRANDRSRCSSRARSSAPSSRSPSPSPSPSPPARTPRSPKAMSSPSDSEIQADHKTTLAEIGEKAMEQARELPTVIHSALSKMIPSYFHGTSEGTEKKVGSDKSPRKVAVAKVDDLKDGEMKQVPFSAEPNSSVLLSKVDGQVYATSSKCTHKGAPLEKGVLSGDGTVRCTGDIEDGPAVGGLNTFKVDVEKDTVYVTASPDEVKARRREPPAIQVSDSKLTSAGVVVIGGGGSAFNCVDSLRKFGFKGKVTLLTQEDTLPYDRTTLSKSIVEDDTSGVLLLRQESFYKKIDVTVRLSSQVTRVDLKKRSVVLRDGTTLRYDDLVIATGTVPRRLKIPGRDLKNIFTLHSLNDAKIIAAAARLAKEGASKANIVMIGSSFISTELSAPLSKIGKVTVVGRGAALFESVLGKRVGDALQAAQEKNGIAFRLASTVTSFGSSTKDSELVGSVELADGSNLPADIVILAVGVKPATSFLKTSKIPLLDDGSIDVEKSFEVKGITVNNVFAIGEVATTTDQQTDKPVRITHWAAAGNQGRAVAAVIAGRRVPNYNKAEVWWSAQTQQLRYVGTAKAFQWKKIVVRGDLASLKFVAYYGLENEIVAVCSMQSDPIVAHCAELFRRGRMPTMDEIRERVNPLDISLK